ncbi:Uncharacterised protein [Rothia dentocariosa]|uniref:MAE-28990/MAE-18760-like HEPN domain-containing protein n=1 Tax=Rothia dentocariosa TaxID=2047 RepID=A0A448UW06_9MICC|nr:Uncharacterised protein [Rothia dentocariosa]
MNKKDKLLYKFEDEISKIFDWRKRELHKMQSQVLESEGSEHEMMNLRAGHLLLYAHWEGCIKKYSKAYVKYINSQRILYSDINNILLASALKSDIQKLSDAHAVDTHLKFVERIFILFGSNEYVRLFPEKIYKELIVDIEDGLIRTESNLSYKLLQDILKRLGIWEEVLEALYEKNLTLDSRHEDIDKHLVERRNKIAHGEKIEGGFGIQEYKDMHYLVTTVLEVISEVIIESARNQKYLRNN